MKVLWLSRHIMTGEQEAALRAEIGFPVEIVHRNVTFPAKAYEAGNEVFRLADVEGAEHVAGVFPAHVAAHLAWAVTVHPGQRNPAFWMPVSVPAPAIEGEVRGGGFVFSHWELFR